ncbi:MAG: SDR family oxidoreductase [Rhodospirillales bacterium]|nr:SDR family oxidoreductase [Rhodospirillales bacterium]MBO6785474.1 SDR family oxidoreductase [Rhodospirillales bacterium]
MRLQNKTAIVVGAGQQPGETMGNGRAVALRFAQEGARVLCVDISKERAQETANQIGSEGGQAEAFEVDVTDEDACRGVAEAAQKRFGRIDILHNNVGRSEGDRNTVDMDSRMWDELMALNLKSMFLMSKHVLPFMQDQGSGAIINVSSTSSLAARQTVTYKTSKGAVNTFTQHLAFENARYGIRANAILPGLMDTPMAIERRAREQQVDRDAVRESRNKLVPLQNQMGTAWDVANAALFLASDEARYITGVLLPVDGGLLIKVG